MDSKSDLRIYAKELRKTLDIKNISKSIVEKIRVHKCYKPAKNVMIFYPMKYEINLLDLLNDDKNFYLPKVNPSPQPSPARGEGENMVVCPFNNNLIKSNFGVMEPTSAPINPDILDLIFVPALLVDSEGYRLGYGGGFYDRFLAQHKNIKTIVPIAKELLVEKLPHEKFDIKIFNTLTQ